MRLLMQLHMLLYSSALNAGAKCVCKGVDLMWNQQRQFERRPPQYAVCVLGGGASADNIRCQPRCHHHDMQCHTMLAIIATPPPTPAKQPRAHRTLSTDTRSDTKTLHIRRHQYTHVQSAYLLTHRCGSMPHVTACTLSRTHCRLSSHRC